MDNGGDEPIQSRKCHNETPCIATINKQKCLFSLKMKDRKVKKKKDLFGGWYQSGWGGYKERMKEGECGGNTHV
jgi:hypothetical protein